MKNRLALPAVLLGMLLACGVADAGQVLKRWSFEYDTEDWKSDDSTVSWSKLKAKDGGYSMRVDVDFPQPATVFCRVNFDVDLVGRIIYHVYVPEDAPKSIKTLLFLKDKDGLWFQDFVQESLAQGTWESPVEVDISASSPELQPSGHYAQWSSVSARQVSLIGLKFFCDEPYQGPIYVDSVVAERAPAEAQPLRVINLSENAPAVGRYKKFELTFNVNRNITNPFDPDNIKIDATFDEPGGKKVVVPAFYYQDYVRRIVNDREELTPVGAGTWKVRFAPVAVGPHSYYLTVRYTPDRRAGGEPEQLVTGKRPFLCTESDSPGFVRVSAKDPLYFEFTNGQWFYPIGHNVHSPSDDTPRAVNLQKAIGADILPNHGTFSYDYLFQKMVDNGENFAEVWMCSWWLGIEWLNDWRNYHGLTSYNLHSAWRLDYLVDLADRLGLYLHLVVDNHGKASTWTDPEWEDNPYNELNGGFLGSPEEFFRNPIAKEIYKKKLRYIIARWGYSTRIAGIELWSEIDLVGDSWAFHDDNVTAAPKVQWHREITEYLGRLDPWHHLLTTHFSTTYARIKSTLVTLPGIDYIVCDAYQGGGSILRLILPTAAAFNQYRKPGMVTEYGGSPFGANIPNLRGDLHAGIWSSYMTNSAGTPLLWWHQVIESADLYWNFKALAAFHKGEERRGEGLATQTPSVVNDSGALSALSLQNTRKAYVWVYSRTSPISMPKRGTGTLYKGTSLQLSGLADGMYSVEVWDTSEGTRTAELKAGTKGGVLIVPLPDFRTDCALKVKPAS